MNVVGVDWKPLIKPASTSISEWVYVSLRHAIMCGHITPGTSLTIRGLADKLAVSPMPIRQALHRLACEGALLIKDNRRVIVPEMTAAKLKALYELRIALEIHAAETVIPYVRSEHITTLQMLDNAVDASVAAADVGQLTLQNQQFHRYLYAINPHQVALAAIESVWLQLGPFLRIVLSKLTENDKIDRHQEAISALQQQNAFALRRAIEGDIRDGIATIEAFDGLDRCFARE